MNTLLSTYVPASIGKAYSNKLSCAIKTQEPSSDSGGSRESRARRELNPQSSRQVQGWIHYMYSMNTPELSPNLWVSILKWSFKVFSRVIRQSLPNRAYSVRSCSTGCPSQGISAELLQTTTRTPWTSMSI